MPLHVLESLNEVTAAEWNALTDGANPFVRHEFLATLEATACVGAKTAWQPRHLVVRAPDQTLLGAVPLYLKHHSYGEYVFDWAWAQAYARSGFAYYPKLVAAIPFTPVTGSRLLVRDHPEREKIIARLIDGALELARTESASSLHWLFTPEAETRQLAHQGLLHRTGYQFHWHNPGYRDFDDFLSTFTAAKRKKVKRERARVCEAGVTTEVLTGSAITSAHWDVFYEFYQSTLRAHQAIPYLTRAFFHKLGAALPQAVVLVLARHQAHYVGAALNLQGRDTLYGRYWGGRAGFPGLHFEVCYYRAIEYGIAHQLRHFEAGAQGKHKLARGFEPAVTYSAHWLSHPQFAQAVADYLARERAGVEYEIDELREHAPFRQDAASRF
jgi:predicted N-acyltransferase